MKILFLSLVLYCLCVECMPFPHCCHRPYYYADFLFMLKCGISLCESSEKSVGNICISCTPKAPAVNQSALNTSYELGISRPQKLCQGLDAKRRTDPGRLVLSWSWLRIIDSPSVFMIEAKNFSSQEGEWGVVGMTNETTAVVSHLDLQFQYQFRVTPVISASVTLLPVTSDWITLLNTNTNFSGPTNITVSEFHVKDSLVEATVEWTASKELPCSYKLFWLPAIGSDYFEQQTVKLPDDDLSAILPGLLFDRNYTIIITPSDEDANRKAESSVSWFITPTCLNITQANFSICAPGPPLNVSVHGTAEKTVVMWMPPDHASSKNPVSGYHVAVVENGMKYIDYLSVEKDTLSVSFAQLNLSNSYAFEVRAMSKGGTGNAAIAEINVIEFSAVSLAAPPMPYHYIVPSLVVLLAVISVTLFKLHRKTSTYKGYPSGVADVDDHIRPFLVSVDKIQLQEVLGKGAFGTVHRGIYTRSKSKDEVAVKVFPSETNTRRQLLHEVEVMCIIGRHNQIVGMHGFTLDIEKMYLILEYCPLGDLHSYLVQLKPELLQMKSLPIPKQMHSVTEKNRGHGKRLCSYIHQVAQGMEYIASLKLIHRDVAARNVLMVTDKRVKIADFGLSRDIYETKVYSGNAQKKLPIKWMAPESIEKQKFSTYTDVWSFGVFMWEVFKVGKVPYPGLPSSRVLEYLKCGYRLEKPHCSQEWYDLMLKCWRDNPRERPQFKDLVKRIGEIIDRMCLYISIF